MATNDTTPNVRLIAAMQRVGVNIKQLANSAGVDDGTVDRWRNGENAPHRATAVEVAERLRCEIWDLWPEKFPKPDDSTRGMAAREVWPSRAAVPGQLWNDLFTDAVDNVDVLVYGGTFLYDTVRDFARRATTAADRGVRLRFLIGDPHSQAVQQRGIEEGIGAGVSARSVHALNMLKELAVLDGIDVRTHHTPLYTSIFRSDDILVANVHMYGSPAAENPVLVFDRQAAPEVCDRYIESFERVWAGSSEARFGGV